MYLVGRYKIYVNVCTSIYSVLVHRVLFKRLFSNRFDVWVTHWNLKNQYVHITSSYYWISNMNWLNSSNSIIYRMQQNYVTEIEGVIKRNFVTPCISGFSDIIYLVAFLSLYLKLTEHFSKDLKWTVNQSCQNIGSNRYLLRSAKVIEATMKNCLSRQHSFRR